MAMQRSDRRTPVHIVTLNPALIAAAFVAGLFWGLLFRLTGSLTVVTVSHSLWSVVIFIIFPVGA